MQLIPLLRQQGLRLDDIRARFQDQTADELRLAYDRLHLDAVPAPTRAQTYLHYPLPGGCSLVAPARMSQSDRQKLSELLQAAGQIWAQPVSPRELLPVLPPEEKNDEHA